MKRYIVDEKELEELLNGYFYALALEQGGVDNWTWESDSRHDFIADYNQCNNAHCTSIEEIADDALLYYEEAQST